jgi:ABC-2 type transport system permease protein
VRVVRLGLARGGIEIRHSLTYWPDLVQTLVFSGISLLVLFLLRGHHVPGMTFSAYVIGKITFVAGTSLVGLVLLLTLGPLAFPGVSLTALGWLTAVWVVALGLLAAIPIGITLGSLLPNPRYMALVMLPVGALTAISGIFYPITHLPGWMQGVGQLCPMYWVGLGMRSALLPPSLAAVEIDGSWRHWLVFGVLAAWAVAGLVAAPPLLRRMARRESGSRVASRREQALLRAR